MQTKLLIRCEKEGRNTYLPLDAVRFEVMEVDYEGEGVYGKELNAVFDNVTYHLGRMSHGDEEVFAIQEKLKSIVLHIML